MKLFVASGAGFIRSNFNRHIHGLGKKSNVVNSDKLCYSFLNELRVRRRENQIVRGRRFGEPAEYK
jgi:dTDP-D-glucose 4,6-dehydratase